MIENNARKSVSVIKLPSDKPVEEAPVVEQPSTGTLRDKILRELNDLKGLEKRENIVRCINDSRAKYASKAVTENTRSSFEGRQPLSRPPSVRKAGQQESSTSLTNDLAFSTISIL
jgi:hypothetical protein